MKKLSPNNIKASVLNDVGELKMALDAMADASLVSKEVQKILTNDAQPLINTMKQLVPVNTGRLRSSITVWNAKRNPYRVYVGPSYKLWDGGRIAHILEYGTINRTMTKGLRAGGITQQTMQPFSGPRIWAPYKGKSTGVVAARPFIRPAVTATSAEVIANIRKSMLTYVLSKANKQGLKTA